jgi:hypothetical protein
MKKDQKVYPRDHPEPKFLDQSNHPLVAAAETPFLTTSPKSRFPLGFAPLALALFGGDSCGTAENSRRCQG